MSTEKKAIKIRNRSRMNDPKLPDLEDVGALPETDLVIPDRRQGDEEIAPGDA